MSKVKKRYAHVGMGSRSGMYTGAIIGDFQEFGELVAICDVNQGRMNLANHNMEENGGKVVPTYLADDFDKMIAETKPDVIIVTTGPDVTHSDYICRAMELGCDVVTEKPMTTDETRCRKILETAAETGRDIRVTFNYRYAPPRNQVKEMLASGAIGEILSVDFAWLLDTRHGADYFRRWHRRRENSGSLLVHKATHHFDLVNWWLGDIPEEIFSHASLSYYTPATAERMGLAERGLRCKDCPAAERCKFHLDLADSKNMKEMYLDCENEPNGYIRDKCVFSDDIDIWDNMSVSVRYRRGALLNYILHAYSPYEGYSIAFNGTKGRLEHHACENTYISGDDSVPGELEKGNTSITLIGEFSQPKQIEVSTGEGGHGGGDMLLLTDIFDPDAPPDPLKRKAGQKDGAYSILIGVAACKSIDTGKAVKISDLLGDAPL